MMNIRRGWITALIAGVASMGFAQTATMSAMTSFSGNGWLAPSETDGFLSGGTSAFERGMAYNPVTGNLLVVTRNGGNQVARVNALTGVKEMTGLNLTGVSGGVNVVNNIGVGADGRIYLTNLVTNSVSSPFKIYRYDNETSAPTLVYSGAPLTGLVGSATSGARLGDTFDVIGSGANTRLVAGYGTTTNIPGINGYAVFTENSGGTLDGFNMAFTGTPPANGDHRLGITFGANSNQILGSQGSQLLRVSDYSLATNTAVLAGTGTVAAGSERPMDFAEINGYKILAMLDSGSSSAPNAGTALVRIYNMTNPLAPVELASLRIPQTADLLANTNGTGSVKWGTISGTSATLYALHTNNGIQAFNVEVVPEPATMAALGLGLAAFARRRRNKK